MTNKSRVKIDESHDAKLDYHYYYWYYFQLQRILLLLYGANSISFGLSEIQFGCVYFASIILIDGFATMTTTMPSI